MIGGDEKKISCDDALIHSEDPPHSFFTNEEPALCLDHKEKEISFGDNTATLEASIDPTIGQTVDTTINLNICNPVSPITHLILELDMDLVKPGSPTSTSATTTTTASLPPATLKSLSLSDEKTRRSGRKTELILTILTILTVLIYVSAILYYF